MSLAHLLPPDVPLTAWWDHVGRAVIVKYTGSLPWHVERQGAMLRRFSSKKLAQSYMGVLNGVAGAAPEFYRLSVADARKRLQSDEEAWASAALTAGSMGLYPADVNADPNTGRPL